MLLQELGYLPDFFSAADTGQDIVPDAHYGFIAEEGFVSCPPTQVYALKGQDIIDIGERRLGASARKVAKYITRQALLPIIGDKPLKSRELFRVQ